MRSRAVTARRSASALGYEFFQDACGRVEQQAPSWFAARVRPYVVGLHPGRHRPTTRGAGAGRRRQPVRQRRFRWLAWRDNISIPVSRTIIIAAQSIFFIRAAPVAVNMQAMKYGAERRPVGQLVVSHQPGDPAGPKSLEPVVGAISGSTLWVGWLHHTETRPGPRLRLPQCSRRRALCDERGLRTAGGRE